MSISRWWSQEFSSFHFGSIIWVIFSDMRLSDIVACGALLCGVVASPASTHVLHEKRDRLPAGWAKSSKLSPRAVLPMRIALSQRNLDKAYEYLHEVSNPASEKYGQHWSAKQVAETFAPRCAHPDPSTEQADRVTARRQLILSNHGSLVLELPPSA